MKTVMTLTGIRPDFIRMAEVFRKLDNVSWCQHVLVHSGQHYDRLLSEVFFEGLDIREPDINLNVAGSDRKNQHHSALVANIAQRSAQVARDCGADVIMFLGDSHTALAAPFLKKDGFRIAHIEAGMRSFDMEMPEEVNRVCCDHMCDWLFTYHQNYADKLRFENIPIDRIHVVGNTIVESYHKFIDCTDLVPSLESHILVDIHRPENILSPQRLRNVFKFLGECHRRFDKPIRMLRFGRTADTIEAHNIDMGPVEWIPLQGYKDFLYLQWNSLFMVSDSGTAQEEPALMGVPVIVPRQSTERPESLQANCSRMLNVKGMDGSWVDCIDWVEAQLQKKLSDRMDASWLGDGTTSQQIVDILEKEL
jgi:UDP-N-acetylglucosamine 2-epimerase (non-hydrolysing)